MLENVAALSAPLIAVFFLARLCFSNVPQLCLVAEYEATLCQFSINFNTSKNE